MENVNGKYDPSELMVWEFCTEYRKAKSTGQGMRLTCFFDEGSCSEKEPVCQRGLEIALMIAASEG